MSNNNFDWAGFWSSHKDYFNNLDAKYKAQEKAEEEKYKGMTTREVMEARHKELIEQEKNKYHTALNDTLNTTLGGYGTETTQPLYQDSFTQSNSVFQPTNTDVNNTFSVQNNMNNTGYQFNSGLSDTSPMSGTYTTPKPSFWDVAKDVSGRVMYDIMDTDWKNLPNNAVDLLNPYSLSKNQQQKQSCLYSEQNEPLNFQQYKEVDTFDEYLAQTPPELRSHLTEPTFWDRMKQSTLLTNNSISSLGIAGKSLYDNWRLMHDIKNRPGNDNEMHRRAQTQIAQQGIMPAVMGQYLGKFKEYYDYAKKIHYNDMNPFIVEKDWQKDIHNNLDGMRAGLLYPHLSGDVIYRDFDDKRNKWRVPLQ